MKINGIEDGKAEVIVEPKKEKVEKVKKPKNNSNLMNKLIPGKDDTNLARIMTVVTAVVTIACTIAFLVLGVINIKDWFGIRGMEKAISENYSSSIVNSKVYIGVDIITATIEGYESGVLHTDFGDIECAKPSGSIILAYYEIDGTLRPLTEVTNNTYGIEYVTKDFVGPAGSIVVTSAADKGNYLEYIEDAKELNTKKAEKKTEMALLGLSFVLALVGAAGFVLTRAGLFDKLVKIEPKNEETKDGAAAVDSMTDFEIEDATPVKEVRKPPVKTDVDPGN